jgi:kynurenine formamidase
MKLVDLSITWGPAITPVTGLPPITFSPLHTHEDDHRSNTRVDFSIHTGTHIDAPFHFIPDGDTIDQVDLERFYGPAVLIDLRSVTNPGSPITRDDLLAAGWSSERISGKRVILFSGWAQGKHQADDFYTANPYLSDEAAQTIADSGIPAVGTDFGIDRGVPYPVHRILLGAEIPIIENLVNLDQLPQDFTLIAFPLKVQDGDGGPARVVAVTHEA